MFDVHSHKSRLESRKCGALVELPSGTFDLIVEGTLRRAEMEKTQAARRSVSAVSENTMFHRRQFLKNSALISLAPTLPTFLTRATLAANQENNSKGNGRILVIIQLDGGNDGINTVVPLRDEGYAKHRDTLRLPKKDLIKLSDEIAFHPRMRSASKLFEDGRLSVVHGVGYPNPNRSHFESMAIWHGGTTDEQKRHSGVGWIGDTISSGNTQPTPHVIHVGDEELPVALRGRRCAAISISNANDLQFALQPRSVPETSNPNVSSLTEFITRSTADAVASAQEIASSAQNAGSASYPNSELANRLKLVAQMIKSDAAARIYYTAQAGYDTHAAQLPIHANLLGTFSSSLKAFMDDMKASGLEDRVVVMAFSEFGRRVKENDSDGTDHGTAGPVFLAGTNLTNRFYGVMPSLLDVDAGDLRHSIDFRDIYASLITDWLQLRCPETLSKFGMPLFAAT